MRRELHFDMADMTYMILLSRYSFVERIRPGMHYIAKLYAHALA